MENHNAPAMALMNISARSKVIAPDDGYEGNMGRFSGPENKEKCVV
jgi:hypothetical protein